MKITKFHILTTNRIFTFLVLFFLLLLNPIAIASASFSSNTQGVQASAPTAPPTLLSPDNQAGVNPTYLWTPVEGATGYHIFVATANISEIVIDENDLECNTGECSFFPDIELQPGETYIWQVKGHNEDGDGPSIRHKHFLDSSSAQYRCFDFAQFHILSSSNDNPNL